MSANIKVNNEWKEATAGYCNVNGVWRKVNKVCQNINGEWKCNDFNLLEGGISVEEATDWVYVYADDGLLYNPNTWNKSNNDRAIGVAIIKGDNTKLVIAKNIEPKNNIPWSDALYGTDVSGIANNTNDYKGKNNTSEIIVLTNNENSSNNAAHYCYSQTITVNGEVIHGYLPAIGEVKDIYYYKAMINAVLSHLDCTTIDEKIGGSDNIIHTSTEINSFFTYSCPMDSKEEKITSKQIYNNNLYAFPVFPIIK